MHLPTGSSQRAGSPITWYCRKRCHRPWQRQSTFSVALLGWYSPRHVIVSASYIHCLHTHTHRESETHTHTHPHPHRNPPSAPCPHYRSLLLAPGLGAVDAMLARWRTEDATDEGTKAFDAHPSRHPDIHTHLHTYMPTYVGTYVHPYMSAARTSGGLPPWSLRYQIAVYFVA